MPDPRRLVSMFWLTSTLALLASVLVAPIRTSGFVIVSSGPIASAAISPYPRANLRPASAQ